MSGGAMEARGDHWHAAGMMTFQHDHLARRGRKHQHMDAVGQLSGPDSDIEPTPAQLQEGVKTPHTVYRKVKPGR